MSLPLEIGLSLVDRGWVPDALIRAGIRRNLEVRLARERAQPAGAAEAFLAARRSGPIAVDTRAANTQHYEVPTAFYRYALGPHLKYSSGWWGDETRSLGQAEAEMLGRTAERAQLADGQRILELGCGWGSLSLWMARHYPNAEIIGVSNSRTQRSRGPYDTMEKDMPQRVTVYPGFPPLFNQQQFVPPKDMMADPKP